MYLKKITSNIAFNTLQRIARKMGLSLDSYNIDNDSLSCF